MKTPVIDGQSIDQFIPAHLRDMFYKNSEPEYKYAISNGYAPYGFSTEGLVLYLPLWALKGDAFKSIDPFGHECDVTGATWGSQGRTFDGDDYIEITNEVNSVLNFTDGDFSIIARVYFDDLSSKPIFVTRGVYNGDGYLIQARDTGSLDFYTNQFGGAQKTTSAVDEVTTNTWYTVGVSRSGASVAIYKDGVDVTSAPDSHIDPDSSARSTKIGVHDDKSSFLLDGTISEVQFYDKALSTAGHLSIHNHLKWRT